MAHCLLLHAIADTIQAISVSGLFYWIKHKPYQTSSIGILNNLENKVLNQLSSSSFWSKSRFSPGSYFDPKLHFSNIVRGGKNSTGCNVLCNFCGCIHFIECANILCGIFSQFLEESGTNTKWSKMHYDEAKLIKKRTCLSCENFYACGHTRTLLKEIPGNMKCSKFTYIYTKWRTEEVCSEIHHLPTLTNQQSDHSFADVLTSRKFSCIAPS